MQCCAGLKPAQLRSAVLVLVQHNFVSCYIQHAEDPRKSTSQTLYEADLAAILQSLRHVSPQQLQEGMAHAAARSLSGNTPS